MQAVASAGVVDRRRPALFATAALCVLAAAGALVRPAIGLAVAMALVMLALADWRLAARDLAAVFVGVVMIVPAGLRVGGSFVIDLTADRILLALLFAAWLLGLLELSADPLARDARRPALALVALAGVAVLSLAVNLLAPTARNVLADPLKGLLTLLSFLAAYFLVLFAVRDRASVERVCGFAVGAGTVAALSAVVERVKGSDPIVTALRSLPGIHLRADTLSTPLLRGAGARVFGTGEHPIAFGGAMAMLLPLALYFTVVDRRRRALWGSSAALIAFAMLLTVSRSALIAAAAGFLVLFVCWPRFRIALVAVAVAGLFAVHVFVPGLLGTFRSTLSASYLSAEESSQNQDNRASDYPKVAAIVPQQPLLGLGFGDFDPGTYFYLDNQALKLLLELGVAGCAVFVGFVYLTVRPLIRAVRAGPSRDALVAGALLASLTMFCVLSVFFDTFGFVQVTYLFFVLSALAVHSVPVSSAIPLGPGTGVESGTRMRRGEP